MLKCIYTSTKTISTTTGLYPGIRVMGFFRGVNSALAVFYHEPAVKLTSFDYSYVNRVMRDGSVAGLGGYYSNFRPDGMIPDYDDNIYAYKNNKLYNIDIYSGLIVGNQLFGSVTYDGTDFGTSSVTKITEGIGYTAGAGVLKKIDLSTGAVLSSIPATDMSGGLLFWTSQRRLLNINTLFNKVRLYPVEGGDPLLESDLPASWKNCCYDMVNNILIVWHQGNTIGHYLVEGAPSNLSAITRVHATVKASVGELFSVYLTGDEGEPIENAWVKWSVTPAIGKLASEYTKTDSTGKASVLYWPPSEAGDTVTILAETTV